MKENINFIVMFLFFFVLIIFSTLIEYFNNKNYDDIDKSFFLLRYFLLIFILNNLIEKIDLKYLLISCLIFSSLLSFDIIYQVIFGKDVFGFKSLGSHNSGFLGKELSAGGYIQRFLLLGIFALPIILKNKLKFNLFFLFFYSLGFIGIIFSGNRMPLLLFIFFTILSIIFIKKLRYEFIRGFILILLIYPILINTNNSIKQSHISFYQNIIGITKIIPIIGKKYPDLEKDKGKLFYQKYNNQLTEKEKKKYDFLRFGSGHRTLYLTAIDTWQDSPLIGSGIRSFRINCKTKLHIPNRNCESHPHNYYLDILNTVGIIGLIVLAFILIKIVFNRHKIINNLEKKNYFIYNALFFNMVIEFFPLRSSGSFFSTSNSIFIFLLLGLLLCFNKYKSKV